MALSCSKYLSPPWVIQNCNKQLNLAAMLTYALALRHRSIAIEGPTVCQLNGPETITPPTLARTAVTMHHLISV